MNISQEKPGSGPRSQDFELNLAPIVDCFTVLITFMLISASFLSIGILEALPNSATASPSSLPMPSENLEITLKQGGITEILLGGRTKRTILIPSQNGKWDQQTALQDLNRIKLEFQEIRMITLSAQNEVEYIHLIRWMDILHPLFQNIYLGGF